MLNNIFQIIFFKQYIVSPKTWIHQIPYSLKINLILACLCFIPYINQIYIITLIITYILIICRLPLPKNYLFHGKHIIFIIFFNFFNNNIIKIHKNIIINNHKFTHLKNKFLFSFLNSLYKYLFIFDKIDYFIPIYILRSSIIYIAYISMLKILYLTTQYENIISYCIINKLSSTNRSQLIVNNKILTIIFSSQFIILLTHHVSIIIQSIRLRNTSSIHLYLYSIQYLFQITHYNLNCFIYTIYYRQPYRHSLKDENEYFDL